MMADAARGPMIFMTVVLPDDRRKAALFFRHRNASLP
jgi:hypothetical protein